MGILSIDFIFGGNTWWTGDGEENKNSFKFKNVLFLDYELIAITILELLGKIAIKKPPTNNYIDACR